MGGRPALPAATRVRPRAVRGGRTATSGEVHRRPACETAPPARWLPRHGLPIGRAPRQGLPRSYDPHGWYPGKNRHGRGEPPSTDLRSEGQAGCRHAAGKGADAGWESEAGRAGCGGGPDGRCCRSTVPMEQPLEGRTEAAAAEAAAGGLGLAAGGRRPHRHRVLEHPFHLLFLRLEEFFLRADIAAGSRLLLAAVPLVIRFPGADALEVARHRERRLLRLLVLPFRLAGGHQAGTDGAVRLAASLPFGRRVSAPLLLRPLGVCGLLRR